MLNNKLVLFHFLLDQFGFTKFDELRNKFKDEELSWDAAGNSIFYQILARQIKFDVLKLKEYEDNIITYLAKINRQRERKINLKYFQYFSLLLTEFYLDKYFYDKHSLNDELNSYLISFNRNTRNNLLPFSIGQLNKLSYWNATGSGKTFILHFNILQHRHYASKYSVSANNYILLTPSEMLSKQHLEDLNADSIKAEYYLINKTGDHVKVIDIYKIREAKTGQGITISVNEFEDRNILFVDEGHKGSSGADESVWRNLREKIGYNGFTFEYSATFGQIGGELKDEYARNILFDYSYGKFHKDGYGKDYWIHNISDNREIDNTEGKRRYLLLNLLLYAQQVLLYKNNKRELEEYNIEAPLLIFIGHTVNPKASSRSDKEDNILTVSDVKILLEFLKDFLADANKYKGFIKELVSNAGSFHEDYFNKLIYLRNRILTEENIYKFIITDVFNAIEADELTLRTLTKAEGEIAIKVKNNESYFALINIGDVSTFKTSLQEEFTFEADHLNESLFNSISAKKEKPINLLIGARKFIEGWNNYRVSSIGLINFGRAEGAQIIQLFGRGVRLRGKAHTLKRTVDGNFSNIEIVETLNIFGLNADYMRRFRDDLAQEGVKQVKSVKIFPIKKTPADIDAIGLIGLRKKTGIKPFCETDIYSLEVKDDISVKIDLSTRKYLLTPDQTVTGATNQVTITEFENGLMQYINWNDVYLKLLRIKREKRYYNIQIEKENLKTLFAGLNYEIISDKEFSIKSYTDIVYLNKVVLLIFEQYLHIFFNRKQKDYEGKNLETEILTNEHPNFDGIDYKVEIIETNEEGLPLQNIQEIVNELQAVIDDLTYPENLKTNRRIKNTWLDEHLYQPLLDEEDEQDLQINGVHVISSISPKGLNKGERTFINDLKTYILSNGEIFENKELYLLRNQSRKGFGFYFEASGGFYPDFILWIKQNDKQYLTFIDPHGLRNEANGFESEKIKLAVTIKELETNLGREDLILSSFILSATRLKDIAHFKDVDRAEELNVFEIKNDNYIERMLNKIII